MVFISILSASMALAADDGSWTRVKKAGKLVIGIDDAFPPMEFRNDKNELIGFDIDASKELGKRLGIKVEHLPTVWDTVILSLKSKKFDIVWSGMSVTAIPRIEYISQYRSTPMCPKASMSSATVIMAASDAGSEPAV